ncbi:PREDICTED: protein NDRG4-like [Acropora digitifera]|uniref:protein NDRG4-like n=1 Tax=Acropora digitifera TaxID=70779 RepID=UPI00077ADB0F|nr:PREDICTED: protein NDRG4-like [Acropora digitifera]
MVKLRKHMHITQSGKHKSINCDIQGLCVRQLQNKGLTTFVEDYLLWHHFGKKTKEENLDLVHSFKQSIQSVLNPRNLSLFINSYLQRTDLQIHRPDKTTSKKVLCLKCPALLITGATSPHQDDVVNTNARLDPEISTYFSVSESGGMPLEEQPHKVATSVFLFLQGLGYLTHLHAKPPKVTPPATREPSVC